MSNISTIDRFWASATHSDGCWEWQLSKNRGGYGQFNFDGDIRLAHRIAFELAGGRSIPAKMLVCHRCDNRSCINPAHLFLGDHADNNRDMFAKGRGHLLDGRHILGERNRNAKLSTEAVLEAKAMRAAGALLQEIADCFGVTKQAIWLATKGMTWKDAAAGTKAGTPAQSGDGAGNKDRRLKR